MTEHPRATTRDYGDVVVENLLDRKDKILRPVRVAQMLNVKTATVYLWIRLGKINARKVGAMWQIMASEVARFISEGPLPEDKDRNKSE